ncbi:histidine phosphatase family protein [Echinicola jeungdonensis]|uniref:Histidine phosphatase family protein n=1 Tax=Echinicola jeungdonensis TaxID=709343 RepID=A0ABV5J8D8_9BACT|nr:histidine phosphatase family protein [Echinicola jeungdonensis]MDN3670004.1 histidine phosphatase family protein [Echinicola jeungdonensis]
MKNLIICRHAKSSWDDPFLDDHKRPLAKRGIRDAPRMAQRLKDRNIIPDLMVSSGAERAKATALAAAEILQYPEEKISFTDELYHASSGSILRTIRHSPVDVNTLFIFGHNPGLNDLIEDLGGNIDNLPTCGQFGFQFETNTWNEVGRFNAKAWFFDFPKNKTQIQD